MNACSNLSRQLAQRGHEVTIATTDFEWDQEFVKSIANSGVEVTPSHCRAKVALFLISPGMRKWLKRNVSTFDVIHLHTFRAYQNSLTHTYAEKYGVPFVLQAHGSVLPLHGSVLPFGQKYVARKAYDILWGTRIIKDAAKAIAVTELEAQQYAAMGIEEEKIEVVPNAVDLSEYVNLPNEGAFRSRYNIENDESLILFLGRLHKIKGIDLLIRAFAGLVEKRDKVRLVIAGPDAGALTQLKRLTDELALTDSVLFTGPLYNQDKLEAYVDAAVYVLPSRSEAFPVTILEACACGTPVITTTQCGIADLVERFGYVVSWNAKDLCSAMFRILRDEETRKGLGEEGNRLVREDLNWGKVVQKIEQIYEDVMASHQHG